jgi:hypothetical protein
VTEINLETLFVNSLFQSTCHAFEQDVKREGKAKHAESSLLTAHEKYGITCWLFSH